MANCTEQATGFQGEDRQNHGGARTHPFPNGHLLENGAAVRDTQSGMRTKLDRVFCA